MKQEYKKLHPSSLEPNDDGYIYKVTTYDHGGVEYVQKNEYEINLVFDDKSKMINASVVDYLGNTDTSFNKKIIFTKNDKSYFSSVQPKNGIATFDTSVLSGGLIYIDVYSDDIPVKQIQINTPKTTDQLIQELQDEYYEKIRKNQVLGDTVEVARLQNEYNQKKTSIKGNL